MADSMSEIERIKPTAKADKQKEAPDTVKRLEKNGRMQVDSIMVAEIKSFLYIYMVYNKTLSESKVRKPDYVQQALEKEMDGELGL